MPDYKKIRECISLILEIESNMEKYQQSESLNEDLVKFIVRSNAIEGYSVDPEEVRSAIEGGPVYDPYILSHLRGLEAAANTGGDQSLESALKIHGAMGQRVLDAGAPGFLRSGMEVKSQEGKDYAPSNQIPKAMKWWENTSFSSPFERHVAYEAIHPFADGNGRSGRILMAANLGFDFKKVNELIDESYIDNIISAGDNFKGEFWKDDSIAENYISRKCLRKIINEEIVKGKKLERYSTLLSREIVKILKSDEVKSVIGDLGPDDEIPSGSIPEIKHILKDIDWIDDLYIILSANDEGYIDVVGHYASDQKNREKSVLYLSISLPRNFDNSILSLLIPEIKETLRHELEHSSQSSEMLDVTPDDAWESIESIEAHYAGESETKAHITGLYKKAKMTKQPVENLIDDYITNLYMIGLSRGFEDDELKQVMSRIRDIWRYYLLSRYPNAKLDDT